jgi:hypothetical protein
MTKWPAHGSGAISSFWLRISFVIRHLSFVIRISITGLWSHCHDCRSRFVLTGLYPCARISWGGAGVDHRARAVFHRTSASSREPDHETPSAERDHSSRATLRPERATVGLLNRRQRRERRQTRPSVLSVISCWICTPRANASGRRDSGRSATPVRWQCSREFLVLLILSESLRSRRLCVWFFNAEAAESSELRREFLGCGRIH